MELRSAGIRVWYFNRASIPNYPILVDTPDPSRWGKALADFPNIECGISKHFKNQSIIANINLCGDWAGRPEIYGTGHECPGTCHDFVANRSSDFSEAYWEFKSFKVYHATGKGKKYDDDDDDD